MSNRLLQYGVIASSGASDHHVEVSAASTPTPTPTPPDTATPTPTPTPTPAATEPKRVSRPTVTPGDRKLTVSWSEPDDGGSPITEYRVQRRRSSSSWPISYDAVDGDTTKTDITGLTNGVEYEAQLRARNVAGNGPWSPSGEGVPNRVPTFDEEESAIREVAENTPDEKDIGLPVSATDDDDDTLTYTLGGTDAASFDIDDSDGQLRTKDALDFETKKSYTVTVIVRDVQRASDSIAVTIHVRDVNESPEVKSQIAGQTLTVGDSETLDLSDHFSDPDSDALSYTAHSSNIDVAAVREESGTLRLTAVSAGSATVTVVAADRPPKDSARLTASQSFDVTVEPPPNADPTFDEGEDTDREVAENTVAGNNVGAAVEAEDPDGDTLTYTLSGTDPDSFSIVGSTGQLRTSAALDFEAPKNSYSVIVSVTDGKDEQGNTEQDPVTDASITVTIDVTDVSEEPDRPDAPTLDGSTRTSLTVEWKEPSNTGPPISDYDVQYRLASVIAWTDLDQDPGTATSATITGLRPNTSYDVQVRADNGEMDSDWSDSLTASTKPNNPPTFKEESSTMRSVAENTAEDQNVGAKVEAEDPDNDTLTYKLEGDDATSFTIVSTSGQVRTKSGVTYNHEAQSSYSVIVSVRDSYGASASIAVTINITDVLEKPDRPAAPTLDGSTRTSLTVEWTEPSNTGPPISDYDVQYKLASASVTAWTDLDQDLGTATSATITGLTANTKYNVQVRAFNGERESDWSDTLTASTKANRPPTFEEEAPTIRSVAENTAADQTVGKVVAASDPDNDTLTYSLVGTDAASFSIDTETGQLKTKAALDFEAPADSDGNNRYEVTVNVSDGKDEQGNTEQNPTTDASIDVTINVTNVNEAPVVSGLTIVPYAENGTGIVATYSASDPEGDSVTWTLSGIDQTSFALALDNPKRASPVNLKFKTPPDFENPTDAGPTKNTYILKLKASDGALESAFFGITVNVVNVDEPGVVTLSTTATVEVGTVVTASLDDPDGGVGGVSWKWQRRRASTGTMWSDIPGQTLDSYTPGPGDQGQMLRASVSYEDAEGTSKSAVSTHSTVLPVQVAMPTLTPGDGSLEVAWVETGFTGVTASDPDRYQVEYKRVAELLRSRAPDVEHPTTKTTITGLVNGELYDVRVRACVSVWCGAWSPTATATPKVKLGAPTDLDVVPMALRQARLTWTASANADANTKYRIEIATASAPLSWSTLFRRIAHPSTEHVIHLDNVVSRKGLANEDYFNIRVVAEDTASVNPKLDSDDSETIRIEDNPLLVEGGRAASLQKNEASLEWAPIPDVTQYSIRFRKLGKRPFGISHSEVHWPGHEEWPYDDDEDSAFELTLIPSSSSDVSTSVTLFDSGEIYAFQINYETTGGAQVFSARDAYVWLSDRFPNRGERVATYPFFGHHPGRKFEYIICENGFPASHRSQWVNLIENAFMRWQTATSGFITMKSTTENCPTGTVGSPPANFIQNDDERNEIRMLDVPTPADIYAFWELKSDVFKICLAGSTACVTSFTGYTGIRYDDEIRRFILEKLEDDDLSLLEKNQIRDLLESHSHDRQAENELRGVDVTFNSKKFQLPNPTIANSGDLNIPSKVGFNTCLDDLHGPDSKGRDDPDKGYKAYRVAVHEAGHALGLGNITFDLFEILFAGIDLPYETAHPTIPESIMNYDSEVPSWSRWVPLQASKFDEPDCSPHPFDIMAIYSLYQKVPK